MKRWQSYRRPNFRSQLILSEFFASQTAIKKCLSTRVLTTLYYMRSIVHADWPVQMLSVAIAGSWAWGARSSNDQPSSPNFALLGDQNPNLSLTSFKRRRTWQQEQAKKEHGAVFPPCVQLQVLLNWSSRDDRRCTARRRLFQKSTEQ